MDQYEVLGQIGKGAFGAALLVRHKQEKKKYVLKKIRLARQTSRCRISAHQEMNLISKMRNPFIVEYKESWVEKGCYVCIVIGYCEGGDMGEAIKNANGVLFPEEKLCKWLVQLLLALDYLHGNHILHRDVKCSNIFLTKDQNIRLGDFGLAKMLTSDDLASSVVGTPSYMCPELLADIPYGSKSDIWSLGCCMYEMASHKPAFKAFDMQALINKIIKSIITPLPSIYSSAFKGLIKSMLRKNPEHRPSASELLKHPLLRPFVIKICQKASTLSFLQPTRRSVSSYTENPEFEEPTHISLGIDTDEKQTSSQDNVDDATNPIAASSELNSPFSVRTQASSNCPNRCSSDASFSSNDMNSKDKRMTSRTPNVVATLRSAPAKILPVPNRRTDSTASKTVRGDSNFKTQPSSVTVANKNAISARRASLPFFSKTPRTLSETKASHILDQTISPYVSVNSPRIDKIAEFPMGSCESPLLFTLKKQTPSSLVRSSASFPPCPNHLTTMDKCTIEIHPKENPSCPVMHDGEDGIQSRYQNPTTKVPSRPRKLDTSSYKQRADALEGLLEFSAKLLQQEKFEELGVLLKPFGPEKVSPRETAIWLAKSFKESTLKEEH